MTDALSEAWARHPTEDGYRAELPRPIPERLARLPVHRGYPGVALDHLARRVDGILYAEGRDATHEEVMESINSGLPLLREQCHSDGDHAALDAHMERAMAVVPRAA